VLAAAAEIGAGDPTAIGELCATLTLSGISMGAAGRTAPGSGMEHTVSHLLEMAHRPGEVEAWHGAKVGALSVLAALLWARVSRAAAEGALDALRFPDADEMRPRVLSAFAPVDPSGAMGEECWADYARKLTRWHAARERLATLPQRWPQFAAELDGLHGEPRMLSDALRTAGAPVRLSELGIEADRARWALANCHLMRDRFTVADLAFFLGLWEPGDVDALLAEAATIGAGL
jgi:glycerol-1-phosphate dehydrogenase [NAD(P)+]